MTDYGENLTLIKLFRDGDEYCALIGEDPQTGTAGFGEDKGDALRNLARQLERDANYRDTLGGDAG